MKNIFKVGDTKSFTKKLTTNDVATFDAGTVHPVYATFALGRDAEWVCRLFVIDMKEEGEEGIGTFLNINHQSPALVGQVVEFTAQLLEVKGNIVICSFEAKVGDRLIATGNTGQKIIMKKKLVQIFNTIK
jgi:fluoroacetyl-CoA thioesterase